MLEQQIQLGRNIPESLNIPIRVRDFIVNNYKCGEKQRCCAVLNPSFPPSRDFIYLPYAPNHINFCIQDRKDVISAPFSGCLMVVFTYVGDCIYGDNFIWCPHKMFGCGITCPYKRVPLVAHVAYETIDSCQSKWENDILQKSQNVYGFNPSKYISEATFGDLDTTQTPAYCYGVITRNLEFYSYLIIGRNVVRKVTVHDLTEYRK